METKDIDDSMDVEGKGIEDLQFRFFPPKFACRGLEEKAELHAEAKQVLLERTGDFQDLGALLDDEARV